MGSQMLRYESSASLSQANSFGSLQDLNKQDSAEQRRRSIVPAGTAVNFAPVAERQDEEDDD